MKRLVVHLECLSGHLNILRDAGRVSVRTYVARSILRATFECIRCINFSLQKKKKK